MPPKPSDSQSCNVQACAAECSNSRGSSSQRFCGCCGTPSCPNGNCYFVYDRCYGETYFFYGGLLGRVQGYSLTHGGYKYWNGGGVWYDGCEWVWEICRSPL